MPVPRLRLQPSWSEWDRSPPPVLVLTSLCGCVGVVGAAVVLGPVAGAAMFAAAVLATVGWATRRRRRLPAWICGRVGLARDRGWRYDARDTALQTWWSVRSGAQLGYVAVPHGIVTGEVSRLPFVAFDTERLGGGTETHWVVALPEAFPAIAVRGSGPAGVTSADPAFAAALATPGVVDETAAHGLWGWRIDGCDLILSRRYADDPCPPAELADVAERLAALYYRFPLVAVRGFGRPVGASAGVPFPGG